MILTMDSHIHMDESTSKNHISHLIHVGHYCCCNCYAFVDSSSTTTLQLILTCSTWGMICHVSFNMISHFHALICLHQDPILIQKYTLSSKPWLREWYNNIIYCNLGSSLETTYGKYYQIIDEILDTWKCSQT